MAERPASRILKGVGFERIAYTHHAYHRMKRRRISHAEVKRIVNEPETTYPSRDAPDRTVAQGHLDDERRALVVYTENHDREANVLVVTVIDCESDE